MYFFRFQGSRFFLLVLKAFKIFASNLLLTVCCWCWLDNLHINPTNLLSPAAKFFHSMLLRHENILWEAYHHKKLPLYRASCFKTKFSVNFITEAQSWPPPPCFFNWNFWDREVHYEKKRKVPFVFVFSLSLRKSCLFLTLSKLAWLRQSLYVLPDQEWK